MTADWLRLFLEGVGVAASGVGAFYLWMWRYKQEAKRDLDEARERSERQIDDLNRKVEAVKTDIIDIEKNRSRSMGEIRDQLGEVLAAQRHMPTGQEIGILMASVDGMKDTLTSISNNLDRVNNYLLEAKK